MDQMKVMWRERKEVIIIVGMALLIILALIVRLTPAGKLLGLRDGEGSEWIGANGIPMPAYQGRTLEEFRPNPEEVKLFNEEQMAGLERKIQDFARFIKNNPDQLESWIQLGLYKKIIGDFEGARDAWEYASLIRPKNAPSFKNLGELYWHYLPDFPRSEMNLKKAIENEPAFFDAYITLSDLYRYSLTEKADSADDALLEGLSKNPNMERDFVAYIARYYKETGNISKAIEYYERLNRLESGNAEIQEELRKLRSR